MVGDEGAGEELTVGRLARRFGLARSTLLYYDRIGVLRPSARSAAGYRLYDAGDVERLARVCHFREVGLPLDVVRGLLDGPDDVTSALAERLVALDRQAAELERQRQAILAYLGGDGTRRAEQFTALLAAVGVDADQRARWHAAFEQADPAEHQALLEFLRLPPGAVSRIREASRMGQRRSRSTSVS